VQVLLPALSQQLPLLFIQVKNTVSLATDPEARVRFPALPEKKNVVGLERGALSLVSTN
jgi:hypothetical protein